MRIFLIVAFLIYGGMHLYAFSKVWQAVPHSSPLAVTLTLLGLTLTLSPFMLWFIAHRQWHVLNIVLSWVIYLWMGFILLFCLVALAFDLGHIVAALLGLKWPLSSAYGLLVTGVATLAAGVYGFHDAQQVRVERIDIPTPKLKSGRVTIAQISDLHLGAMLGDAFLERVLAKACDARPDVIVATGDILDGQGNNLGQLARRFRECAAPGGKFAVLGNHEYFVGLEAARRFLRDAGFMVLRGEAVKAQGLVFAGVDDASGLAMGQETRLNADAALKALPGDAFVILLKHQPVVDMNSRFDLQLSGHIHGGQIFPFNFITQLTYKVHSGLTELGGGRWLYVSRGAGTWGPPMRLFAPAEITLITIEAAKTGGMQPTPGEQRVPKRG